MIFLICFLAAFGLGRCLDQLQSRHEIETSINRTITEVERLIEHDPTLPRLSRTEIVDILYNITSKDMESLEESVEKTRQDYQRALTVVLPYNAKDAKNEDIKDLFTKPPIIQIIPDADSMVPYSSIREESPESHDPVIENLISTKSPNEVNNQFNNVNNEYKNHRATYDEPAKVDSTQQKFNLNFNKFNSLKTTWPTTSSIIKLINSDNNINSTTKPKLEIIYSTPVTQKPITRMLKSTTLSLSDEFRPTMPTKSTVNILTSDQWKYFAPPSTTSTIITNTTITEIHSTTTRRPLTTTIRRFLKSTRKPTTTTTSKPFITTKGSLRTTTRLPRPSFKPKPQPFLPTVISTTNEWPTHPSYSPTEKISEIITTSEWPTHSTRSTIEKIPESSPKPPDIVTLGLADMVMINDAPSPMLFVTPLSSKVPQKIRNPVSTVKPIVEKQEEIPKTSAPIREKVVSLLASIGLKPTKDKIGDDKLNLINEQGIFATNFDIPTMNNTLTSHTSALIANNVDSPSIISQNTFDNVNKDVRKGVDNLSPDVQLLFQRFGLQTSDNVVSSTTFKTPTRYSFQSNSWNSFKPLPKFEVRDESMRDFLAKFGLGVTEIRSQKSMKNSQQDSIIDAVPHSMKNILENIGLIVKSKVPRKIKSSSTRTTTTTAKSTSTENPEKIHVFKPHETIIGDAQQKLKINELLDTVKLVQKGDVDVSEIRKIADDLLKKNRTLQDGPNPLNFDEVLRLYNDDVKNEVKRQESKANSSDDTTTTTSNSDSSDAKIEVSGDNSGAESSPDTSDDNSDGRVVNFAVTPKVTTTTEVSSSTKDSNLDALADSFGGSTAEPDPVLPTPRKSGLYFLVDWNSFLEVGVDGEDKVNLRFAPKVGDRTRFIPVTVS